MWSETRAGDWGLCQSILQSQFYFYSEVNSQPPLLPEHRHYWPFHSVDTRNENKCVFMSSLTETFCHLLHHHS